MTEAEWLAGTQLHMHALHLFVGRKGSERKLRLFACACVRRAQHLFIDPRSLEAVEAAERYAEGLVDRGALKEVRQRARQVYKLVPKGAQLERQAARAAARAAEIAAMMDKGNCFPAAGNAAHALTLAGERSTPEEENIQLALLRDILGNPFRSVALLPAWRTPDVCQLAQGIYQEQTFERLPILADALEEAGCTDAQILAHLRGGGTHVRGCWPLDLLLGRE